MGDARVPEGGGRCAGGVPGAGAACRASGSRAGRLCCSLFGGEVLSQEGVPCSGLFPCFAVRPAPFPPSDPRPFRRLPRFPQRTGRPLPRHTRSHARVPHGWFRVRGSSLSSFRARLSATGRPLSFVPGWVFFVPGRVSFVPGRVFRPSVPFLSSRVGCLSSLCAGREFCAVSVCVRCGRVALPP